MNLRNNSGSKFQVLLVEDNELYSRMLHDSLQGASYPGFRLHNVQTLDDAKRALHGLAFDVILLDLALPDSQGLETFTELHKASPSVPIIVLTATEDENMALEAVHLGAQEYLVKGQVDPKMLIRVMRYAIERKQAEQELREREEFFRLITENVSDLIAVLDKSGKRLYNSPSYKGLIGDPKGKQGSDSFVEIHPDDRDKVHAIFQQTLQTGQGQRTEYRFVLSDGSVRFVESVGNVIRDSAGQNAKVVVVSRDMTDQKIALERLRDSETLYHSLVESLPQTIFRKDLDGRFTFVNNRFCSAVKKSAQEVLGCTDFDFFPKELAEKYREDDLQVMRSGQILETIEQNEPSPGKRLHVQVVKIPIYNAEGKITGIQGIYWDITKQKEAEEALLRTLADLKRSHAELKATQLQLIQAAKLESVGTLAAGVAHEVKNPLQTMLMGLHYLDHNLPKNDENIAIVLQEMRDAVRRADKIVRGLLHFSASQQTEMREESLNSVIAQSLILVKYELTKARVQLMAGLEENLPPVLLDKTKMEQVFINLFMNAVHAMPQGGTLTVRTLLEEAGQNQPPFQLGDKLIAVYVEDTGQGISEENLSQIFVPFFTTKPTGVGTGLGLPVTKKIIEMHGGTIEITNSERSGVVVALKFRAKTV